MTQSINPSTEAPSTAQLLRLIEGLSAGWDEHGSTGPREPYSWETVARMAMDYARAALSTPPAEPSSDTPREGETPSDVEITKLWAEHGYLKMAHILLASPPPEAQAPSEPVLWQWRWTNPGGYENQPDEMLAWKLLDPSPGQTVQQRIDELLAYRHKGEPCYEVRALYAAPVSEQDKRDAVHAAISRALLEGGVTHEVLCGMCIEVGLEAFDAALKGEAP